MHSFGAFCAENFGVPFVGGAACGEWKIENGKWKVKSFQVCHSEERSDVGISGRQLRFRRWLSSDLTGCCEIATAPAEPRNDKLGGLFHPEGRNGRSASALFPCAAPRTPPLQPDFAVKNPACLCRRENFCSLLCSGGFLHPPAHRAAASGLRSWSCRRSAMRAMNSLFVGLPFVFDTV